MKTQQFMFDELDPQKEHASDVWAEALPLQGVCKDCGTGTLNNNLNPAFEELYHGGFCCIGCGSQHLDLL